MGRAGLIREAHLGDFRALVELEAIAFPIDRFSDRQVRYTLTRARATTFVCELDGRIQGSAVMVWRKYGVTGHLSSISTHPEARGLGLGRRLLLVCEEAAARRGCRRVFLEVRVDNTSAIAFYERHGYEIVGRRPDYYADGQSAFQMLKYLTALPAPEVRLAVPYVAQSRPFTGGAACVMMAVKQLSPELPLDEALELALSQEAALGPAEPGLGGCGALGMALAAKRLGYDVKALVPGKRGLGPAVCGDAAPSAPSVEHIWRQARQARMTLQRIDCTFADIAAALRAGVVPILALRTSRLQETGSPHWVVATGFDEEFVFIHDPYEGFCLGNGHRAEQVPVPIRTLDREPAMSPSAVFVARTATLA